MPDFLTSHRKEAILNSDICEKLDSQATYHHGERGLPRGEADKVTLVAPTEACGVVPCLTGSGTSYNAFESRVRL